MYIPSFLAQDVVEDTEDALDFTLEPNKDQILKKDRRGGHT